MQLFELSTFSTSKVFNHYVISVKYTLPSTQFLFSPPVLQLPFCFSCFLSCTLWNLIFSHFHLSHLCTQVCYKLSYLQQQKKVQFKYYISVFPHDKNKCCFGLELKKRSVIFQKSLSLEPVSQL